MFFSVAGLQPRQLRVPAVPLGGSLAISDSPEYAPGPGWLYRDAFFGTARILYHHVNASAAPLAGAALLHNPGPGPLRVQAGPRGDCAGLDYMGCGAAATAACLAGAGREPQVVLPAGEGLVWASRPLARGELWTALLGLRFGPGPAVVYTGMLPPEAVPPRPGGGPVPMGPGVPDLPLLPPAGPQLRGTQPFSQRALRLHYRLSLGPAALQLANPPRGEHGTWQEPLPGEFWPSLDATTGQMAFIAGNYGVTYRIFLTLTNDTAVPAEVLVALNPRGGPYLGPLALDGHIWTPPRPIAPLAEAWAPAALPLPPGESRRHMVEWVPAGASFLPVRLLLLPVPH